MAEHLMIRLGVRRLLRAAAWLCLAFVPAAFAEVLVDPTRPPPLIEMTPDASSGAERSAGPRLQSILISANRRVAVVSGKILMVGDKLGDAELIRISESEVAFRNGRALQILKLQPAPVRPADATAAVSKRDAERDRFKLD